MGLIYKNCWDTYNPCDFIELWVLVTCANNFVSAMLHVNYIALILQTAAQWQCLTIK